MLEVVNGLIAQRDFVEARQVSGEHDDREQREPARRPRQQPHASAGAGPRPIARRHRGGRQHSVPAAPAPPTAATPARAGSAAGAERRGPRAARRSTHRLPTAAPPISTSRPAMKEATPPRAARACQQPNDAPSIQRRRGGAHGEHRRVELPAAEHPCERGGGSRLHSRAPSCAQLVLVRAARARCRRARAPRPRRRSGSATARSPRRPARAPCRARA